MSASPFIPIPSLATASKGCLAGAHGLEAGAGVSVIATSQPLWTGTGTASLAALADGGI